MYGRPPGGDRRPHARHSVALDGYAELGAGIHAHQLTAGELPDVVDTLLSDCQVVELWPRGRHSIESRVDDYVRATLRSRSDCLDERHTRKRDGRTVETVA
jgi:hypothetical protein